ncbi:hypothetical protein D9758_014168 [Tetrapyrgos nigripes]|uniref:beta-N-acetylhexosaminidase n=1 Tax=Tetrapyrgos nigripes TaxID=182062 RepID=A0A8H5CKB3_9AGAR|nr:hypothetical protein D9758_014168 [Tetrapyrgos nigripes]
MLLSNTNPNHCMTLKAAILVILVAFASHAYALWPLPKQLSTGSTTLKLSDDFDITFDGDSTPQDLLDAIGRTKDFLRNDKLQRLVVGRGASDADAVSSAQSLSSLVLSMDSGFSGQMRSLSEEAIDSLELRVEGYSLTVPSDGSQAELKANSTLGLFRGLTTFSQLWYDLDGTAYTVEAPIAIVDEPPIGLMLDTARNYFPVADIKRTLDTMSWVKINTFHWHISDSQSFPLQVPGFPELAAAGPYSPSMVYTPEDVKDIRLGNNHNRLLLYYLYLYGIW